MATTTATTPPASPASPSPASPAPGAAVSMMLLSGEPQLPPSGPTSRETRGATPHSPPDQPHSNNTGLTGNNTSQTGNNTSQTGNNTSQTGNNTSQTGNDSSDYTEQKGNNTSKAGNNIGQTSNTRSSGLNNRASSGKSFSKNRSSGGNNRVSSGNSRNNRHSLSNNSSNRDRGEGLYLWSNLRERHQGECYLDVEGDSLGDSLTGAPLGLEDVVIQPMIEQNVKTHTERSELERPRRVGLDDCCGYCERYREGAITPHRRMEIETWRQDVNQHHHTGTGNYTMRKSVTVPIDFRYSPPGYPADEPGFRRIKVKGDLKKDLKKLNLERDYQRNGGFRGKYKTRQIQNGGDVEFSRLASDVAAMSMDYDDERRQVTPSSVRDLPSTWKRSWPGGGATSTASPRVKSGHASPRIKSGRASAYRVVVNVNTKNSNYEGNSSGNSKQKLNRNDTKMTSFSSRGSTNSLGSDSDQNDYRTCSNDLLNVISIDDFRMRHKRLHQQPIREDSTGSLGSETRSSGQQGHYPSRSIATGSYRPGSSSAHAQTQRRHLASDSGRGVGSPSEDMYGYYDNDDEMGPSETVARAFQSILCGSNMATNSHAHRGLYKYHQPRASRDHPPQGQQQPAANNNTSTRPQNKESKRFRKLNRALHDWIENEIVIPHQNTRGWYLSSSGSYHASQSTPTSSSQGQGHGRSGGGRGGQSEADNGGGGYLDMVQEMDENQAAQ